MHSRAIWNALLAASLGFCFAHTTFAGLGAAKSEDRLYPLACGQDSGPEKRNYEILEVCWATDVASGFISTHLVIKYVQTDNAKQSPLFATFKVMNSRAVDLGGGRAALRYELRSRNGISITAWDYRDSRNKVFGPALHSDSPGFSFTVTQFDH